MKILKKLLPLLLCALLVLCMASCSKGSTNDNAAPGMGAEIDAEVSEKPGFTNEDTLLNTDASDPNADRKIIKTYRISAESKDFDAAITSLSAMIDEAGGYVESSSVQNKSINNSNKYYSRSAQYTIRVPAEKADAFVSSFGSDIHVTSNTSSVEDVSVAYYSTGARLEELEAERDSLLEIMKSINTQNNYNFWLTINQRLSEVRQQIAVYQKQLTNYDSRVSYSTVHINLAEVINYSEVNGDNSFGSRMKRAFVSGWSGFWEGCQDFTVWFVGAFPTLLVLAVIATAAVLIILKVKRKKRAKKDTFVIKEDKE